MKTFLRFCVASAAMLSALALSARAQTYQITDLGPLEGAPTYATPTSDNNIFAGYALPTEASLPSTAVENQPAHCIR